MADDVDAETPELARLRAERDQLRAERDRLDAELARTHQRSRHRGWWRRITAIVLVVASCVTFTAATVGVWARNNFLDTDRFVSRIAPLVDDPAVQAALTTWVTNELMTVIDSRQLFENALPERGRFLAVPLKNAVQGFVQERVAQFVATDEFHRLWEGAATIAHREAVSVLRRESQVVVAGDREVTINLIPVIDAVLARITAASPEIFGRTVDLPDVKVGDVPAAARQRLGEALGVDLGPGFGQFTVYDDGQLSGLQQAVALADRYVPLLLPLSILLAGLALWASDRRRRTLLQLAAGLVLGMVLVRRIAFRVPEEVAGLPRTPQGREVAGIAAHAFVDPLLTFAGWVAAGALLVAIVALATGPYPWAVTARRAVADLAVRIFAMTGSAATDDRTVRWVAAHRDLLLVAIAVATVLVLAVTDLSWLGLVVTAAVFGALALAVARIAAQAARTEDTPPPPSDGVAPAVPGA